MKIIEKIAAKSRDLMNGDIPTIAFLGDSVTQGCFEIYMTGENSLETVFDEKHAYHSYIRDIFRTLFPNTPVNIVNAGISGDNLVHAYERLEKDVLRFKPDLLVVSFGLNDALSTNGIEGIDQYKETLRKLYRDVQKIGCEIIFLTENMMNTYVSFDLKEELFRSIAKEAMRAQNEGILTAFFEAAKEVSAEFGVPVCDIHGKWLKLYESGVDTTALLANRINHPTREMNRMTAYSLVETMFK